MIYVDSSVLLADLFAEPRSPPEGLWEVDLVASRLLAYEVWNRFMPPGKPHRMASEREVCWLASA